MSTYVLTLSCGDRPGIVHAVSGTVLATGGNIVESQQFGDPETGRFFMRVEVQPPGPPADLDLELDRVRKAFEPVATAFGMSWQMQASLRPLRALILVSRGGHCLNDLLFRVRAGSLRLEVPAVVGNHDTLRGLAEFYRVPFHLVPVTAQDRDQAEQRLLALVRDLEIDLVVLARYMQVLSDRTCAALAGRAINIHHSFLPSFRGARPYHQAHAHGVKLIGATAHYVTPELDEGPIIEQDVVRVGHESDPDQLAAAGRDVEAQVLARAVKWHSEHRVLLNGHRTVVFH